MPISRGYSETEEVENYLQEKCSAYSEASLLSTKNILVRAEKYADSIEKSLFEFEKKDFVNMFNENNWVKYRSSFDVAKTKLSKYMNFVMPHIAYTDQKQKDAMSFLTSLTVNELNDAILRMTYFQTEHEFLQYLYNDINESRVVEKLVSAMYWLGFSPEAISATRVGDISKEKCTVNGKPCSKEIIDFILDQRKIDSYTLENAAGNFRTYHFCDDDHLIRNPVESAKGKRNDAVVSVFCILQRMKVLNKEISNNRIKPKYLHRKPLNLNRQFCECYDYEQRTNIELKEFKYAVSNVDSPFEIRLSDPFSGKTVKRDEIFLYDKTLQEAKDFVRKYNQWKSMFYK